jgi:hypothetical protein
MAETDKEILEQFGRAIVPELQAVSKRFADSIEMDANENSLIISASPYIGTLIDGRPPTSSGAATGSPTLQKIIRKWIDEKGIIPRAQAGRAPSLEQLSWAISKSIHVHGDKLYQQGGGNNIFDGIITNERINNLLNLVAERYLNDVSSINLPKIQT